MSLIQKIQDDREVCNNCFRRFRRIYPIEAVFTDGIVLPIRNSVADLIGDERYYRESDHIPTERVTGGLQVTCVCGCPYGTTDRPLSKARFLRYGENLYDRIVESTSIEIDKDRFMTKLEEIKSDPDEQFAETRMFEKAYFQSRPILNHDK